MVVNFLNPRFASAQVFYTHLVYVYMSWNHEIAHGCQTSTVVILPRCCLWVVVDILTSGLFPVEGWSQKRSPILPLPEKCVKRLVVWLHFDNYMQSLQFFFHPLAVCSQINCPLCRPHLSCHNSNGGATGISAHRHVQKYCSENTFRMYCVSFY